MTTRTMHSLLHQVDAINDKFAEARDEIDYANEDAESTYFDESYKSAETATNEARNAQPCAKARAFLHVHDREFCKQ